MKPYIQRITQITVLPEGEAIFSDMAIEIIIRDEAAGEYVSLRALNDEGEIVIDPDNWEVIKLTIDQMIADIKKHESQ
jgi:hypothetical protein